MRRLEQLRVDLRLTRDDLASAAGTTSQTVWRLETGKSGTSDATLWKLADALTAERRKADDEAPAVEPSELLRDAFKSSPSESMKGVA